MKITKKIGNDYVTIEGDEIDRCSINDWDDLKIYVKTSIETIIVFGVAYWVLCGIIKLIS